MGYLWALAAARRCVRPARIFSRGTPPFSLRDFKAALISAASSIASSMAASSTLTSTTAPWPRAREDDALAAVGDLIDGGGHIVAEFRYADFHEALLLDVYHEGYNSY